MAMPAYISLLAATLCLFSNLSNCNNDFETKQSGSLAGFGTGLLRRQSQGVTKAEQLRNAIKRSGGRLRMFLLKTRNKYAKVEGEMEVSSRVHAGNGEFLMEIGIGTPTVTYNAIVDTGSDLIWTQCKPCTKCFTQPGQIFDPSHSQTYTKLPCSTSFCEALPSSSCSPDCKYQYQYGDNSFSAGDLAYETFTVPALIPRVAFGCGHDNEGSGFSQASGLVGLGRGGLSFISQLGSKVNNKFSYCLLSIQDPPSKTSPLLFGSSADLSGAAIKSTPLVQSQAQPSFYYLQLEGVSVEGSQLNISAGTFDLQPDGSGGVIIDSGTTITYLEQAAYDSLRESVEERMKLPQEDGSSVGLDLCYSLPSASASHVKLPAITFHFAGAADYHLPDQNAFYVDEESRLICLAMAGSSGLSIFGNIQQQNFHILYDLGRNTLSFTPTTCDAISTS